MTFVIEKKAALISNFFHCNLVSWTCLTSLSFNLGVLWDHEISHPENGVTLIFKTPNYVGRHAIDMSFVSF